MVNEIEYMSRITVYALKRGMIRTSVFSQIHILLYFTHYDRKISEILASYFADNSL